MSIFLVNTTETYRASTENEVKNFIEEAKNTRGFNLKKYTSEYKEVKQKGEVVDSYYKVTLTKEFNDIKYPEKEILVKYKDANLVFEEDEEDED